MSKLKHPSGCIQVENGWTCNKYCDPGENYCPHHLMMFREKYRDDENRRKRSKGRREYKKAIADVLAHSPLAAHNPKFDTR